MDIDWARTLGAGGVTLFIITAVYIADHLQTDGVSEVSPGLWPYVGGVVGIVLAMLAANAFLPG